MGCDEHLYVERFDGKRWIHVPPPRDTKGREDPNFYNAWGRHNWYNDAYPEESDPAVRWAFGRDYRAYSCMAGVRSYGDDAPPVAANRGFPSDASQEVTATREKYGSDGHSDTEIDLAEMDASQGRLTERWHELMGLLHGVAKTHNLAPEHVRVVVWFDN